MTPAHADIARLIEISRRIGGERAVTTEPDDLAPWLSDWRGRYHGRADAILSPASTAETAEIVRAANELNVPLVPQGGNTSMVGGATPPADGSALILSTRRMRAIRSIDRQAMQVVAEAGVILADLHDAALDKGMRFPLTLGGKGSARIGGLVSTNAGGTQVLRFGTMRRLVAGIEAVMPDGSVHDGLASLKKDNRGYDLNQLLIGAEGTLGIVTAATLTLVPAIAGRVVAWAGLDDPHDALTLLRRLEAATSTIESFEIIPGDTLELVVAYLPGARAPLEGRHRWHVLIESASADPGAPLHDMLETALGAAIEEGLVADAVLAANEAQAEAFWRLRDGLSEAEKASGPAAQHDISVPVSGMPTFIVEGSATVEAAFPGTHAIAFGHLGDGNVHFHIRAPEGMSADYWYGDMAPRVSRMVHDLVVAAGGSISAEHGIGQMKLHELERLGPPSRLATIRAIKSALDPKGLFNPGKLVNLAPRDAAT